MRVTLLQRPIDWCNPGKNRTEIEQMMAESPETDLIVLAEMFSTGFCMQPGNMAEPAGRSETVRWMKQVAMAHRCALAGSLAVEESGRYYNRFYFVCPDGEVYTYNKRHLFTYGGEHRAYTPGAERVVVTYQGVRILLQVCYDLRFPVWARNRGDYDMVLYVANWPASRVAVWDALLRARAIENQCYVVGVNRVGDDPFVHYSGHSAVIDAYGRDVLFLGEEEGCRSFSVDMDALQAFRQKFPVLDDGDPFVIE